ncbi:MAG: hypothetical protein SF066_08455 [Thermoanaerobaculia bacterium]|nr:hypothetical protein [Thermoanaerobaculia bacterium]
MAVRVFSAELKFGRYPNEINDFRGAGRPFALALGAGFALLALACSPPPPPVLWAWDRPEDLTFLVPGEAAVAALAGTVELAVDASGALRLVVTPRRGALRVPTAVERLAVVRLEAPPGSAVLTPDHADEVAGAIEALVPRGDLQLDFDATVSQRPFYRALLARLARPGRQLSIVALASWCSGDPWVDALPISRAVPMLYRMGPDGPAIRAGLLRGEDFRAAVCRRDLGVADDEPVPQLPAGRRLWLFSERPWTRESFRSLLAEARNSEVPSGP